MNHRSTDYDVPATAAAGGLGPDHRGTSDPSCPRCESPFTEIGQPSRRQTFACGSYGIAGRDSLQDQSEVCHLRASMQEAWRLVNAMAGQEHWNRAEEWLSENSWAKPSQAIRL